MFEDRTKENRVGRLSVVCKQTWGREVEQYPWQKIWFWESFGMEQEAFVDAAPSLFPLTLHSYPAVANADADVDADADADA